MLRLSDKAFSAPSGGRTCQPTLLYGGNCSGYQRGSVPLLPTEKPCSTAALEPMNQRISSLTEPSNMAAC
jgi:hypothetical protein